MKNFIEIVAEERIDYAGSKIQSDNTKYDKILNKIKSSVSIEVLDLIDDLERVIIDNHHTLEVEIYKQGFKDGMEVKNIL